jgi:hypothetical protein
LRAQRKKGRGRSVVFVAIMAADVKPTLLVGASLIRVCRIPMLQNDSVLPRACRTHTRFSFFSFDQPTTQ